MSNPSDTTFVMPELKLKEELIRSESRAFNVSVRAWLALIVIGTVCFMSVTGREIKEPLYTLCVTVVSFYYAQREKPNSK